MAEEIDGGGDLLGAAQEGFWGEQRTGAREKRLCGLDSLLKNSVCAVVTIGEAKPGNRKGRRGGGKFRILWSNSALSSLFINFIPPP